MVSNTVNSDIAFIDIHFNVKRDILKDTTDPWNIPIKYCVESPVNETNVIKAIKEIENNTCVKFQKINRCTNKTQELLFQKECYRNPYIILHEIGHALSLVHEHSRIDRDKHVTIDYNSMNEYGKYDFVIRNEAYYLNYPTYYDYSTLMHYEPYSFSTFWSRLFGYPVIKSTLNRQYSRIMGQRRKMTFNEYKRINLCYCNKCYWVDNRTDNGYPDYQNCSNCICPTEYTGKVCDKIMPSDKQCGNITTFNATNYVSSLVFTNKMKCYILLKAKNKSKKIYLSIMYANTSYKDTKCTEDMKDKETTGLLLCETHIKNMKLKSEARSILVFYRGESGHSLLAIAFKQID
uniref:Metalloendopeptidase n=1 Tax=Strongyloides stercoralis TaxID=6248 RepID=A0A0K0EGS2_STRER